MTGNSSADFISTDKPSIARNLMVGFVLRKIGTNEKNEQIDITESGAGTSLQYLV